MDMNMPYEWLPQPVMFHSERTTGPCKMTPEQCAFKSRTWVNWGLGDLVYGRAAVYFFTATIGVFIIAYALGRLLPRSLRQGSAWLKILALTRSLSYRDIRLRSLRWNSPSLGVCLLGLAGTAYFMGVSLGPKPYYWPNTPTVTFGDSPPIANRSGYLSLGCLPFILVFGAKANLVTAVTGVAPEKLIIFHLFAAWGMFVLALMHTFPFVVYHEQVGDIAEQWSASAQWLTGVVALAAQAWLTFMSLPFVRHRAYEFFKIFHFLAAAVFVVFLFIHCEFTLTSWDYFVAAGALYFASLLFTMGRTYFAHGLLRAQVELETEHAVKVTVPANFNWRPGQHMYLRFLTLGVHALTAHPFTICSIPTPLVASEGKTLPETRTPTPVETKESSHRSKSAVTAKKNELVFYVRPRKGFTGRLAALARQTPGRSVPVFIEGPYGGMPARWSEGFDKTLVVAGGAGAGFSLGLIEDWIVRRQAQPEASSGHRRELTAIVSSRDPGLARWFINALHDMVEKHTTTSNPIRGVRVLLHQTGGGGVTLNTADAIDRESSESTQPAAAAAAPVPAGGGPPSPSGSVGGAAIGGGDTEKDEVKGGLADHHDGDAQGHGLATTSRTAATVDLLNIMVQQGQADLPAAIRAATVGTQGAHSVGVAVCGPSSMAHDVSSACAAEQQRILRGGAGAAEVWLHQEGFSN